MLKELLFQLITSGITFFVTVFLLLLLAYAAKKFLSYIFGLILDVALCHKRIIVTTIGIAVIIYNLQYLAYWNSRFLVLGALVAIIYVHYLDKKWKQKVVDKFIYHFFNISIFSLKKICSFVKLHIFFLFFTKFFNNSNTC